MVNHSWLWILRNGCHHSSWQRISFVIYGSPHQGHRNNWAWGQCDQLDDKETTQTATRSRQTSFRDSRLRSLNVQLDKSSSARNKRENWWTGSDHAFDIGMVQVIDASFLLRASVSSFIALLKNAELTITEQRTEFNHVLILRSFVFRIYIMEDGKRNSNSRMP